MYPYLKELTLDEALQLPPDTIVSTGNENSFDLKGFYITTHYEYNGKLYCDALTYATHILKQPTPPEGYGYAAYELDERYYSLPYGTNYGGWGIEREPDILFDSITVDPWNLICFRLTDLARVERENPFTDEDLAEFVKDDNEGKPQYWIDKYKELETKYNAQAQEAGNLFLDATERATLESKVAELEAVIEKQRIDINNYCRAVDKANEQSGEFWQLLLRTQELNQQYQIALTRLL